VTLNIDLEEVPFAILEAVKARILANRRRLQRDQQQPRPSLRPRPQFTKIGANSKSWRLPKPAAMVLDDSSNLGHFWLLNIDTTQGQTLTYRYFSGADPFPTGNNYPGSINTTSSSVPSSYKSYFATGDAKQVASVQLQVADYPDPPDPNADLEIVLSSSGVQEWTARIMQVPGGYLYQGTYWEFYWVYDGYEQCSPVSGGNVYSTITDSIDWSLLLRQEKAVTSLVHSYDRRHLVLPAGNGNFIVVVLLSCSWIMKQRYVYENRFAGAILPTQSYFNVVTKAFICNDTKCRPIEISQTLSEIIDQINPNYELQSVQRGWLFAEEIVIPKTTSCPFPLAEPWETDNIYNVNDGVKTRVGWRPYAIHTYGLDYRSDTSNDTYYVQPDLPDYEPTVHSGLRAEAAITPAVYATLNSVYQFIDSDAIKSFPETGRWIVELEPVSNVSRTYGYYSLAGDPEQNTGGNVEISSSFNFTISAPYHPDFPDPASESFSGTLYTVWDWDDPDYCRRMLAALGFQQSDLQP
jgi:hypothetical protein